MSLDLNTTNPLSFIEWRQHNAEIINATELSILYNNYLADWKTQKEKNTANKNSYTREIYTQFLNNITLDSIDPNAARFLEEIDLEDIYELEVGVHYFVSVIKSQLKNIKELRDEATFSTTKNKYKTSKAGISQYIKNYIVKFLSINDFVTKDTNTSTDDINISKIANNIEVTFDNYASDEFIYQIHDIDKNIKLDIEQRVLDEVLKKKNILQSLTINQNGKQYKIETNTISRPTSVLTINQPFTDYQRLPGRYFRGENKSLNNLKFVIERKLIEKYLANDLYIINGDKNKADVSILFNNTNTTNNLTQRFSPNLYIDIVNAKKTELFPYQLSYKNTGISNFNSFNISYNVNLSAYKSSHHYVIPNPNKYQPGLKTVGYIKDSKTGKILRNIKIKQQAPLNFFNKNDRLKNNDQSDSIEFYNNKISRTYGYQSLENSLDYTSNGINKREDSISFWEDSPEHLDWKNTDTYPVSTLNVYPEEERLNDLLITNKTGIKLRSDVYGNQFYFVKSVHPKRHAGTTYITNDTSTDSTCITTAEYYDGLFFDPLLSALSAAEYKSGGTLYTTLTGMYDYFIVSHTTDCSGSTDEWVAPLTDKDVYGSSFNHTNTAFPCNQLHSIALSCGSVSAVSAIDGGSFLNHPGNSSDLLKPFFSDTTAPYFTIDTTTIYTNTTTTYEASGTNNPSVTSFPLFDQSYEEFGEVFVRNISDQKVYTLKQAMSAVFNKHTSPTKGRVYNTNKIQDFEIIENMIYIQTNQETLTEVYVFEDGKFKNNASSKSIVS